MKIFPFEKNDILATWIEKITYEQQKDTNWNIFREKKTNGQKRTIIDTFKNAVPMDIIFIADPTRTRMCLIFSTIHPDGY